MGKEYIFLFCFFSVHAAEEVIFRERCRRSSEIIECILMDAAKKLDIALVQDILEKDAPEVDEQDEFGMTPLFWVARAQGKTIDEKEAQVHLIRLLKLYGASTDVRDITNKTMRHYAALNGEDHVELALLGIGKPLDFVRKSSDPRPIPPRKEQKED